MNKQKNKFPRHTDSIALNAYEVALLIYALEDYDLEELEENPQMRRAKNDLTVFANNWYKEMGLDYSQFQVQKCPHCHKPLPHLT